VLQKGLGPVPIPIAKLSAENLSDAIRFMLEPEVSNMLCMASQFIEESFHRISQIC
jgi:sterol 3beta-glucosyltransferase